VPTSAGGGGEWKRGTLQREKSKSSTLHPVLSLAEWIELLVNHGQDAKRKPREETPRNEREQQYTVENQIKEA